MAELRIGKVSAVNVGKRMVRVRFLDVDITSGWLKVLRSPPSAGSAEESKTEVKQEHFHEINFIPWFPEIGENVLCIYNSGFNEDGYVIGGL